MQRKEITKQDIQCYQTGSPWLEVFGSVHMLVSTVCYCLFLSQSCLFAWALPCWQPRSIFSFLLALQVWALAKVLQRSAHCSPSFLKDRFFFISFDLILWSCFFDNNNKKSEVRCQYCFHLFHLRLTEELLADVGVCTALLWFDITHGLSLLNNDTVSCCSDNAVLLNTGKLCIFTPLEAQVITNLPRMTVLLYVNSPLRSSRRLGSCKSIPGPLELAWKWVLSETNKSVLRAL